MRLRIALLFILVSVSLFSVTVETASLKDFIYGTTENCAYDNWISHVSEGTGYSEFKYAPFDQQTDGFGNFYSPDNNTLAIWNEIVEHFLAGEFTTAEDLITTNNFPYEIVEFHDIETARDLWMLREEIDYS